jgi:hypothetical protein
LQICGGADIGGGLSWPFTALESKDLPRYYVLLVLLVDLVDTKVIVGYAYDTLG